MMNGVVAVVVVVVRMGGLSLSLSGRKEVEESPAVCALCLTLKFKGETTAADITACVPACLLLFSHGSEFNVWQF
jgi:hypothetical protein